MNKEIEELAKLACDVFNGSCDGCPFRILPPCPPKASAERIYNAGYRKTKVGRWITHPYSYECSLCEFEYELDVIAYDYNPITDFDLCFCSVCGAKMEGDNDA